MKKFIASCLTVLLLGAAAVSVDATEVWLTSQVLRVYPQSEGTIVLLFTSDAAQCTSPATPKQQYITVGQNGVTADGLRAMQATAMTAFTTGRRLAVAFDDATTACYINRIILRD